MSDKSETPKCPYCLKPIESPVAKTIIDRGWSDALQRQYVRERGMVFCSAPCASNYQMGCEG